MALEPVNERPIIPQLYRPDAQGVSGWSISLVRQLTTVFQQYGYRINKGLTVEDLGSEGGTLLEAARLVSEGGNIPELDQLANFANMLQVGGADLIQTGTNANGTWVVLLGAVQVCWQTRLQLSFAATSYCEGTWTLPRAFSDDTYLSMGQVTGPLTTTSPQTYAGHASPTVDRIGNVAIGSHTAADCDVLVHRINGTIDFVAGDFMYANVIAIGAPS